MNWTTSLLVLVIVAAQLIAVTSALECYLCDTNKDGACGEEFKEDKANTCNIGAVCYKVANKVKVKRGCVADAGQSEQCTGDEDSDAGRTCFCKDRAKCNTAVQSVSSVGPLTALGFVAFTGLAGRLVGY